MWPTDCGLLVRGVCTAVPSLLTRSSFVVVIGGAVPSAAIGGRIKKKCIKICVRTTGITQDTNILTSTHLNNTSEAATTVFECGDCRGTRNRPKDKKISWIILTLPLIHSLV